MRAVTFQAPGEVRVDDVAEPELTDPRDAIIRVEASGVCGSDLHIYHGRVAIEQGFTIGHEYVGTVKAVGDEVTGVAVGDRVLGTYGTACGECFFCRRGDFHKCDQARVFGHGATLGNLQGAQADQLLVPNADLTLRRIPEGMSDDVALFAGDVMGTGFHAVAECGVEPGSVVAVLGLGPVGLCAVQSAFAAGAAGVVAVDTVAERLDADPVRGGRVRQRRARVALQDRHAPAQLRAGRHEQLAHGRGCADDVARQPGEHGRGERLLADARGREQVVGQRQPLAGAGQIAAGHGAVGPAERAPARAHASSRSTERRTLPLAVFGSSAAKSTMRGYL